MLAQPAIAAERFTCPMHAEVEQDGPGRCPVCGMALVPAGDPFASVPVRLETSPRPPEAGKPVTLALTVFDPRTHAPLRDLEIVHERPIHLFVVSAALDHLDHLHPELAADGRFLVTTQLPANGRYLVVAELVPRGGPPQSVLRTLVTRGYRALFAPAHLPAGPRSVSEGGVTLELESAAARIDGPSELAFRVSGAPIVPWLGAGAHFLLVSEDLTDAVHAHADLEGGRLRFSVHLARAGAYRLWAQVKSGARIVTLPFVVVAARPEGASLR
jgi:hypothetical protein